MYAAEVSKRGSCDVFLSCIGSYCMNLAPLLFCYQEGFTGQSEQMSKNLGVIGFELAASD
jgi:hypothetical protein